MFRKNQDDFQELALVRGFTYIDEKTYPALTSFLSVAKQDLKIRTRRNLWDQHKLISSIQRARSKSATSDEAIARSYDEEYANSSPRYGYASAILSHGGFELITGLKGEKIHELQIIDVGAGSNEFLRFCRDILGITSSQLHGSDISRASREIIESDGFSGYQGRLEKLNLPKKAFDMAYLSYFIDYDTDQAATFGAVIDIIKSEGQIVLEGLFPVQPFGLLENESELPIFLTRGVSALEDVMLVMESFERLGKTKRRNVLMKKLIKTHRFVHSHYGFHRLPSYFLVFSVAESAVLAVPMTGAAVTAFPAGTTSMVACRIS